MLEIDDLLCNEDKASVIINNYKKRLLIEVCEWRHLLKSPELDVVIDKLINRLMLSFLKGINPFPQKGGDYQKSTLISCAMRSYEYKFSQRKAAKVFNVTPKTIRNRTQIKGNNKEFDIDINLRIIDDCKKKLEDPSCKDVSALEEKISQAESTIESIVSADIELIDRLKKQQLIFESLPEDDPSIVINQKAIFEFGTNEDLEEINALKNYLLKVMLKQ